MDTDFDRLLMYKLIIFKLYFNYDFQKKKKSIRQMLIMISYIYICPEF